MTPLKHLAIKYALSNNWQEACQINEQLLRENPSDIDALNRLAFACIKIGRYKDAKKTYNKVILLDKTNPIALKNLKKLDTISKQTRVFPHSQSANGQADGIPIEDLFIEEAGKTKTLHLKNVADKKLLSLLQPGDIVKLVIKRSKIFIQTSDVKYIGMLPDNVGMRLISFMKGGNEYQACIKSLDEKSVSVFIKEVKKSARFKNQPSFMSSYFHSSSSDEDR